ncbi:DNA-binding transcriptional regulator, XRE-family HTH domain [Marininema mesophilum]|uniref:DNA-binding transcriptional regulator, XRE-family HTH domain n=1 Tax=Marininema mesophilum TaxID=1048340 RepID=A0A1H3BWL9_9BACL|nr:DNA-binding transcriptional regulator, XRE-family HTH domain [Marininema mesophilum]
MRHWLIIARTEGEVSFTQEEIATKVNVKRQYYGMIEKGTRTPSVSLAKRIANILNFNWVIFFDSKGNNMLLSEADLHRKSEYKSDIS